jgi:hypothetical protein
MDEYFGEQPVGTAFVLQTGDPALPFLCHAPTMRVPGSIEGTDKVYAATWAALLAIEAHNRAADLEIGVVGFPAMGTGFGGVSFDEAARQMAAAYRHYLEPPPPPGLGLRGRAAQGHLLRRGQAGGAVSGDRLRPCNQPLSGASCEDVAESAGHPHLEQIGGRTDPWIRPRLAGRQREPISAHRSTAGVTSPKRWSRCRVSSIRRGTSQHQSASPSPRTTAPAFPVSRRARPAPRPGFDPRV